jgi:hypothetical protein
LPGPGLWVVFADPGQHRGRLLTSLANGCVWQLLMSIFCKQRKRFWRQSSAFGQAGRGQQTASVLAGCGQCRRRRWQALITVVLSSPQWCPALSTVVDIIGSICGQHQHQRPPGRSGWTSSELRPGSKVVCGFSLGQRPSLKLRCWLWLSECCWLNLPLASLRAATLASWPCLTECARS